jgi:hypothetical protein
MVPNYRIWAFGPETSSGTGEGGNMTMSGCRTNSSSLSYPGDSPGLVSSASRFRLMGSKVIFDDDVYGTAHATLSITMGTYSPTITPNNSWSYISNNANTRVGLSWCTGAFWSSTCQTIVKTATNRSIVSVPTGTGTNYGIWTLTTWSADFSIPQKDNNYSQFYVYVASYNGSSINSVPNTGYSYYFYNSITITRDDGSGGVQDSINQGNEDNNRREDEVKDQAGQNSTDADEANQNQDPDAPSPTSIIDAITGGGSCTLTLPALDVSTTSPGGVLNLGAVNFCQFTAPSWLSIVITAAGVLILFMLIWGLVKRVQAMISDTQKGAS